MFIVNPEKLYELKEVGKRIKKIRGDYTLEEFGFLADRTSKAAVYNWENGKSLPNKERLKLIAVLGRTTVQWVLFGDFPDYLQTMFTVGTSPYSDIKHSYSSMGNKELFDLYESAPKEVRQEIIDKTIDQAEQSNWSYSDAYDILDSFLVIADSKLKRNHYAENLPLEIKELLSAIEKQNLTEEELDSLLDTVRDYFKS